MAVLTGAGVLALAPSARADRRSFLETYEYMTQPEGAIELEVWNRQIRQEFDLDSPREFELELEIEYGITDHWDIALYQDFAEVTGPDPDQVSSFGYERTKIESRYRFGERGQYPVDVLVYLELTPVFGEDEFEIEPKVILARDFGPVTLAFNAIGEVELEIEEEPSGENEVEAHLEPGWSFGATYEAAPSFKVGAETFGEIESPGDENEVEAYVGPSASWGPSPSLWVTSTVAFGLTDESADLFAGFVVGLTI